MESPSSRPRSPDRAAVLSNARKTQVISLREMRALYELYQAGQMTTAARAAASQENPS
jgi:hypothetical protein